MKLKTVDSENLTKHYSTLGKLSWFCPAARGVSKLICISRRVQSSYSHFGKKIFILTQVS